jgi:hypothetical protein
MLFPYEGIDIINRNQIIDAFSWRRQRNLHLERNPRCLLLVESAISSVGTKLSMLSLSGVIDIFKRSQSIDAFL